MRNRAKCKQCNDIIESYHDTDYVVCSCEQIAVHKGAGMHCYAQDWANFIRIDDEGNEFMPKIVDKDQPAQPEKRSKPTRDELMAMLESSIQAYDNLPQEALFAPVTGVDLLGMLMIIQAIFKADE